MALLPIKRFLGLRTGSAEPEVGAAGVANNFRRNRTRGQLEVIDGYSTKLTFVPTTWDVDSLTPLAVKSFHVADNGGRTITLVVANYDKVTTGFTGADVPASGIFVRPWYDGAAWQDSWRELTEFFVFEYDSAIGSIFKMTSTPSVAIPDDYFNDFVLVRAASFEADIANGYRVTDSTTGDTTIDLTVVGDASDLTGWSAGDLIYAFRNPITGLMPQFAAGEYPQIRAILDELRVSTGNAATDLDVSAFYRSKSFFDGIHYARVGLLASRAQHQIPSRAIALRNLTVNSAPTGGLPEGTYTFRAAITMDDGQETELKDVLSGSFPETILKTSDLDLSGNVVKSITTNGTYVYTASYLNTGTYNYLYKIDANNAIVRTVQLTTATDGRPIAINVNSVNGLVYVLMASATGAQCALAVYNTNLDLLYAGTWVANNEYDYLYGAFNATHAFVLGVNAAKNLFDLKRFNVNTFALESTSALQSGAFTPSGFMAADANYVVTTGTDHCYRWDATAADGHNPTDLFVTLGSVATSGITIASGYAYIGAGAILKRLTLSTSAVTDLLTGGDADGWTGMTSNSTHIYGVNDGTVKKITIAGALVSSYADTTPTDYIQDLVIFGSGSLFGVSGGSRSRLLTVVASSTSFVSNGFVTPGWDVAASPGFFPVRGTYFRVYVSKDGGAYYLLKSYSCLSGGEVFSVTSVFDTVKKHRYYVSTGKIITAAEYTAATTSAITQIGRSELDSGVLPYAYAITANNKTYAVGVYVSGRVIDNRVYTSPYTGDGLSQYDVLANDATTVLDVEFNDGDACIALGNVADRVLVLKGRSLVLLTPNSDGTHTRDIVSTGVGIAAARSLVSFDEALYWVDHSGVWQFSTGGLKHLSDEIDDQLFALTDTQRAAAIACVDPKNRQYRVLMNSVVYVLDLADGEWTTETGASQVWFDTDLGFGSTASTRRYMQLVGTNIQVPAEDTFAGTCTWETTDIELPLERGYDGLMSALYVDYDVQSTTPTLTLSLYLDEKATATKTYTLPTTRSFAVTVPAPLFARCKTFKIRITAVVTAGQKVRIRRLGAYFNQIPIGGNQQQTYNSA